MTQDTSTILVFARNPRTEGKALGLARKASIRWHAQLLERTLRVARATGARVLLVSDSPTADLPQRGSGFEERFLNALTDVAGLGIERMVVIGSDTPGLSVENLQRALSSPMRSCVGPAKDGGFYLLGIRSEDILRLRGLPWQKKSLMKALLERLPSHTLLQTRNDVDDWLDLVRVLRQIPELGLLWCASTLPSLMVVDEDIPPEPVFVGSRAPRGPPLPA